ncbi:DNA polymerase IV [Bacillus sp. TH22]|nr:DNA polymerase IV [Bacillus sp. TH45]MBK5357506.1 DNA polymerase IV [Bacillus sp. TH44]MBK5363629.1 DNA polymerase IV [Bacillus sp. TH50]MBK5451246.1 DNA polymerase IV [Bacillus sp. TH22]MBK5455016.1 DNA polymerase IV [Bacillus sp. TH23]MCZ6941925.1 DNA polymerase IV [Bacillus mycoides]
MVVSIVLQVKGLFNKSSEKIILDEFDRSMYTDFWTEDDWLLNK